MDRINFQLGERKYVCIKITSSCREPFEVASAKYVLRNGSQEETRGDCEIRQSGDAEVMLSAIIQPMIKGTVYTLEYTYTIGQEILIYDVKVNVT